MRKEDIWWDFTSSIFIAYEVGENLGYTECNTQHMLSVASSQLNSDTSSNLIQQLIQFSYPTQLKSKKKRKINSVQRRQRCEEQRWMCSNDGDTKSHRGKGGFPPSSSALTTTTPSNSSATVSIAIVAARCRSSSSSWISAELDELLD
ncbi:hypothetical protein Q3G72_025862 [Acer saccharum]|nr:hypothetical protein Q3G72_025862 [Acer saccharum]